MQLSHSRVSMWKIYICQEIEEASLTIVARLFLSLVTHVHMREKFSTQNNIFFNM